MSAEEGTLMGDEEHNPLANYEDLTLVKPAEIARRPVNTFFTGGMVGSLTAFTRKSLPNKRNTSVLLFPSLHLTLIYAQNADNDLWEANRMVTSGIANRKGVDLDFEDESQSAVHVMVHNLKPPFLDGRTVFTKQLDPINPIRDPTSDMAVFAKKGSALVKEKREQAERQKAAAKLAALGGTALGNILGVKDEEADAEGVYLFCSPSAVLELISWHAQLQPRQKQKTIRRRITRATLSLPVI